MQPEEPNEEEAPKLELKPLPEELKYAYLGEQQTYPVVIFSQLTHDQEGKLLSVLKRHKTTFGWTLNDIKGINALKLSWAMSCRQKESKLIKLKLKSFQNCHHQRQLEKSVLF